MQMGGSGILFLDDGFRRSHAWFNPQGAGGAGKKTLAKASVVKGEPDQSAEAKGEWKGKTTLLKPEDQLQLQEWVRS